MALPLPRSLSPSKVAAFKDCALAFRFSVIDRLPEPPSPWAAKGTLVHRALELLHCEAPGDRTVARALSCLDVAWGELVVTDYKTGKVPGVQHEQSRLGGVHFYAFLCEQVFGRRPARIQLLYLSEPVAIVAEPSDQSIRGLERRVGAIWTAVEKACDHDDFRPKPSRLCEWCAYQQYCPAFGGDPAAAVAARPAEPVLI